MPAAQPETGTLGKAALAARLGWSRPTLDRRLKTDPSFPVVSNGTQAGGWEFDPLAVEAYLAGAPAPVSEAPPPAEGQTAAEPDDTGGVADNVRAFPAGRMAHQGEATARQRKDEADAAWREDKLRKDRKQLVEAVDVRDAFSLVLVELRTQLLHMPEALAKEFGLSERIALSMQARVEAMMRSTVTQLRQKLNGKMAPEGDV